MLLIKQEQQFLEEENKKSDQNIVAARYHDVLYEMCQRISTLLVSMAPSKTDMVAWIMRPLIKNMRQIFSARQ